MKNMLAVVYVGVVFVTAATFSSAAILMFDDEAVWLASVGAAASDVSSQTYDGATGGVDGTYTTSGGTGGVVEYVLATTAAQSVEFSNNADFLTGTTGQGIRFSTPSGSGSSGVDTVTMTMTAGNAMFDDVFAFSISVHDLFDTINGEYGFKIDIKLVGEASVTVFDTGNAIDGIGGNASASIAYTGPGGSSGSRILGDNSNANVGDDGAFFGFTSTTALESITLTKTTVDDGNDNWGFDEFNVVEIPAIPEPSTTLLTLVGGMYFLSRRSKSNFSQMSQALHFS